MLEFIIPRLIRMLLEKQSLTEKEALTFECSHIICFVDRRKRNRPYHLSRGGLSMDDKTNFIVYCIEEYKNAKGMNAHHRQTVYRG